MPDPSSRNMLPRLALVSIAVALLLIVISNWRLSDGGKSGAPAVGGAFTLTDQDGKTVTNETFKDHWRLVYFGYAFCPDVCPTELQTMADALEALGPLADQIQPIFITIDPARDTPERLKQYVPLFGKKLIGLTGTPEQIAEVARAYRVYYAKAKVDGADTDTYLMDHSSFVYLMKKDGTLATLFPANSDSDTIAKGVRAELEGKKPQG